MVGLETGDDLIVVENLDSGERFQHRFDQLLIATGASPVSLELPGSLASNIHQVNSLPAGSRLHQELAQGTSRKAVVIGGGYIGLEMAEALHLRGLEVILVQRPPQLMNSLDADLADLLAKTLRRQGVTLLLEQEVTGFVTEGEQAMAVLTTAGPLEADLFVLGLGVVPNSRLAAEAGLALGPKKSIAVDHHCRTSRPGIWAAGDCAQSHNLVSGQPGYLPLGTVANKQGRVAGMNLAGREEDFPGVVGTAVTKFMEVECGRTGLGEKELAGLGIAYVTGTAKGSTLPRYYPGASPITVKVHAEHGSGRLLGAQIVGGPGAAKRIDVAATALHARFNLEDMLYLDLGYAPPFSGVWEPLVIACRMALKQL